MAQNPGTIRRLALIRLLLDRAAEAASQPVPYSTDAVSRLHDVSEMWLALAVEKLSGNIPKEYMGYWIELEKSLGRPLSYRAQMTRLNKARVNLKHYGIEPARVEVDAAVASVRGLLTDETPEIFGISLDDVALSTFVTSEAASKYLEAAEEGWRSDEHLRAMGELRMSFDAVIRDYVSSKTRGRDSIFSSVGAISSPFLRFRSGRGERDNFQRDLEKWQKAVEASLESLDESLILIGLGVDLRRYGMFNMLTPHVSVMLNGDRVIQGRADRRFTDDQFEFCRNFVVQTALYLGEFDYGLDADVLGTGNEFEVVRIPPPNRNDTEGPAEADAETDARPGTAE